MNVNIFHGTGSNPDHFWFPWLQRNLEQKNYRVWLPQLPNADKPCIDEWLPFTLKNGAYDENTILVGHSSGCALILSVLENIKIKVKKAVLVAGFAYQLDPEVEDLIIQKSYNWDLIKRNVGSMILINSDNDPWGCDDKAGKFIFDNLGGTLIIRHGEGHMGSNTFNQPYREFPLLLELIESSAL
jgi:predicted alpha/beta hydrolase family esterase